MKDEKNKIIVRGAREHNLKNIFLEVPKNKLIVFTGVSGSGKSSLAFDTIFAEGQRRYVESLSAYARQFLGQREKPDVDSIEGLSPAVAIDQKSSSHNPRSTVATITEIYDYLRVLFSRVGTPYCPDCGVKIEQMSVDEIVNYLFSVIDNHRKANDKDKEIVLLSPLILGRKGEYHQLLYDLYLDGFQYVYIDGKKHYLGDKILLARSRRHDIEAVVDSFDSDSLISKSRLSENVELALEKGRGVLTLLLPGGLKKTVSSKFTCPNCRKSFAEIEPRLFSFNSPYGACELCHGLGSEFFWSQDACPRCNGSRLRKEALSVKIGGKNIYELTKLTCDRAYTFLKKLRLEGNKKIIGERIITEISDRLSFLLNVGLDYLTLDRKAETLSGGESQRIRLASQIGSKLTGVLYVLDEPTIGLHQSDNEKLVKTLKDIRDLGNTVIVVEHDQDTILSGDYLVDIGPGAGVHGGKIVVSGELENVLKDRSPSLTVQYLAGEKKVSIPSKRRAQKEGFLTVVDAQENNLKNITVKFPLKNISLVTGVSGSGKSTLVNDILAKTLQNELFGLNLKFGLHNRIEGKEKIDKLVLVDQSPIGRTPRSNPATYTGVFTLVRELFSKLPSANKRGYAPGRFSFNVKFQKGGGRCESCAGDGFKKVEMHFLPAVYVKCEVCKGRRFSSETLEVKYRSKSIADILEMTVEEAELFFKNIPKINDRLEVLSSVGLGYVKLGQPAPTLSGGEAQRVKLAAELMKRQTGKTLYIFDEPTVGLHFFDIQNLVSILHRLVDHGNTVIVIEHNLDVIKQADWIIDLGPGGGERGGKVVFQGVLTDIIKEEKSKTAKWLKRIIKR